jgi:hypothetical protein
MPKVKGPLFSQEASGTLGGNITFDRRGFVRQHVTPANPQTAAQGNQRVKLLNTQKVLTFLGAAVIALVKAVAPVSYRWNSYLLAQVLGTGGAEYDASIAAFNALTVEQRADWNTDATALGITQQSIPYATDAPVSPGAMLFAVARTLFRLGIGTDNGVPDGLNSGEWSQFYRS